MVPKFEQRKSSELNLDRLDEKYDTIIEEYTKLRPSLDSFRHKSGFQRIDDDSSWLELRMLTLGLDPETGRPRDKNGEIEKDDHALEGIIYYMAQQGQLLTGDHFGEASSFYDDHANGADVLIGITQDKTDYVASIDACSATTYNAVEHKFAVAQRHFRRTSRRSAEQVTIPFTSNVVYYRHEGQNRHLPAIPHYILGANPAAIQFAVSGFNIDNRASITNEVDETFRRKLLIELLYQSNAGKLACQAAALEASDPQAKKEIIEVAKTHDLFRARAIDSLIKSFNISAEKIMDYIHSFIDSYAPSDRTFAYITGKSRAENKKSSELRENARMKKFGHKTASSATEQKPSTSPKTSNDSADKKQSA